MATVAELAAMYRQRIPASPTETTFVRPNSRVAGQRTTGRVGGQRTTGRVGGTPPASRVTGQKVGPRGTTTNDLIQVARFGLPAMRKTTLPQPASPYELPQNFMDDAQSAIIGGPGPGYGEKYGGFPTASQQEEAILGEAMGAYEMADLARQQADEAKLRYYDEMTGRVAERIAPIASLAGVRPGAMLSSQDREKLMAGYQGVRKFGETDEYLDALDRQNQDKFGLFGQQSQSANEIMRRAYETMLNAPNLDVNERVAVEQRSRKIGFFPDEQELYQGRIASDPYVSAPEQLAASIDSVPLSQYAQQIAQARYGMDPSLAAGMFGPQADINFQKMMSDAQLYGMGYTGDTVGESILRNRGPEAYQQYMTQLEEDALYGSESEQRRYFDELQTQENRAFDQEIANEYGFYPEEFGKIPAEEVRSRANDPLFQQIFTESMKAMTGGGFGVDVADDAYQSFLQQTGDSIGARILREAISKFDFAG